MLSEDFEQAQYLSSQVEQARQRAVLAASDSGASRDDARLAEQQAREHAKKASLVVVNVDQAVQEAKDAADRAEAPTDSMVAELAGNPVSLTRAAVDQATGDMITTNGSTTQVSGDARWVTKAGADIVVASEIERTGSEVQVSGDNRWVTNEGADNTVSALLTSDGSETQVAGDSRYLREVTANSLYTSQLDPRLIGKAVSIQYKSHGAIKYTCTTIHMNGTPDARALKTYWDEVQRTPSFQAREQDIEKVRDRVGATVIANGAGLVHSIDPHGEGAIVTSRGAIVVDGVAVQDFPTDGYWSGYEGFAMLKDGTLKGYSGLRGDTVADAVDDGAVWLSSFGPILVEEGMARDLSDPFWDTPRAIVSSLNIYGQRANGDIVMIGGPGKSSVSGGTLADSAAIALQEGCEFAISMDRGGSAQTFVGGAPIVVSQDRDVALVTDYNKRLVANFLYTNLPVVSPVKSDKPDLFYTATLFKADTGNARYVPRVNVSASGRSSLSGRMILTPSAEGGTLTAWPTSSAVGLVRVPPYARPSEDVVGMFYGNAKFSGRYQVSAADGVVRISNCDAGMTYALLDQIQWQIERAY